jgi:PAS domain S-box-containing protein
MDSLPAGVQVPADEDSRDTREAGEAPGAARSAGDLQQQLAEFENIYRSAPVGLVFVDTDLRYIRINERLAAINGVPVPAHIGRTIWEVLPEIAPVVAPDYQSVIDTGEPIIEKEVRGYTKADPDVEHVYLVSYYPIRDHSGRMAGVAAVVQDFTAQKHVEEALRQSERRFALLMQNLPGAAWMKDLDGRYVYANQEGERIFRTRLDDLRGKTDEQVFPPDIAAQFRANDLSAIALGRGIQTIETLPQRDGPHYSVVSKFPIVDDHGNPVLVGGVAFDITEQRRAEEALRKTAQELHEQAQLLDLTQDAILALRLDGTIEFWNRGAEECYGWRREEAIGQNAHELLRTEFPEPFAAIHEKLATEGHWQGELLHTRRNGNKIYVASRWTARRGAGEQPSGYLEITSDLTERKRVEEQLRQMQRVESLGILAGGIAHDFNNLLVGILGNASLALDIMGRSTPVRKMLEDLITAGERAADLTRQLLAYAGKEQLATQSVNLSAVVMDLAGLLRASIPKTVCLTLDVQEPIPYVNADQTQLQQVVMNLVINASEAIPQDTSGTVTITTTVRKSNADDRKYAVMPLPSVDENYVVLTVADTGQGMTPEVQSRIFDPFYTTKSTGRGLGLSAVLGIVNAHQGSITLKTAPGAGTSFALLLPPSRSAVAVSRPRRRSHPPNGSGTVLVVDDEPAVLAVSQRTLEQHGYQVLLAEDGQQAIHMLRTHPEIVAIVLDLAMPVMTGDQAAPHLHNLSPTVPIILSSGYPEAEARKRFARPGVASFLQKPYQAATLVEKLSAVLSSQQEAEGDVPCRPTDRRLG